MISTIDIIKKELNRWSTYFGFEIFTAVKFNIVNVRLSEQHDNSGR